MANTYIADTCDVTSRSLSTGKTIFTGTAQLASVAQELETEEVRGGIGNKKLFTIKSSKDITLQVRDAMFDSDYLEMQQGTTFENGTAVVTNSKNGVEVTDGTITLDKAPYDEKVLVINVDGDKKEFDVSTLESTSTVTIDPEFAKDGELVTIVYREEVEGKVLSIDAEKFPENFEVEFKTIEFDKNTNKVVKDIYFKFFSASPDGSMEYSFENGTAIAPEIGFECLTAPNSSKIGEIIEVMREETP